MGPPRLRMQLLLLLLRRRRQMPRSQRSLRATIRGATTPGVSWEGLLPPRSSHGGQSRCAANGRKYSRSGQTLDEIVFKKNPAGGYYGEDEDGEFGSTASIACCTRTCAHIHASVASWLEPNMRDASWCGISTPHPCASA